MKLALLFFVMDVFILLSYPPVFIQSKLRHFMKSREAAGPASDRLMVHSNRVLESEFS